MIKHCHHQKDHKMNYATDVNWPYRGQIIQMYEHDVRNPEHFSYAILLHKNTHKSKLNETFFSNDEVGRYSSDKLFAVFDEAIADACKVIDEHIKTGLPMSCLDNVRDN